MSSYIGRSLLDLHDLDQQNIQDLFDLTHKIEKQGWAFLREQVKHDMLVHLVFLEPSTRTTMSFETASYRSGYRVSKLSGESSSTLKGETLEDTLLTLNAMKPNLMVVRHGTSEKLSAIAPKLSCPLINAGEGTTGHPTQALLDAYTIWKERGQFEGERVLIVGDVVHSRVAASLSEILEKFNVEVGVCGPKEWCPENYAKNYFQDLFEGLAWCTSVMALRVQKERHTSVTENIDNEFKKFQLNPTSLKSLSPRGLIFHPGPFNRGVEISSDVLSDPRCRIWNQVEHGVYVRGALMAKILGVVT